MNTASIIDIAKTRAALHKRTSDRYQLFDTETLVSRIETVLHASGYSVDKVTHALRTRRKNAKSSAHTTTVRLGGIEGFTGLMPTFTLRNSFNGEGSLKFSFGVYRLVCSNGLSIGTDIIEPISIKHIQGEKASEFFRRFDDTVREAAQLAAQGMAKFYAKYKPVPVADVRINRDAFLTFLRQEGVISEGQQRIATRHAVARYDALETNAWGSFNAAQEALMTDTRGRQRNTGAAADRNAQLSRHFDAFLRLAA